MAGYAYPLLLALGCSLVVYLVLWNEWDTLRPRVGFLGRSLEKYDSNRGQLVNDFKDRPCPRVYKYPLPSRWLQRRVAPGRGHADQPYPDPWGAYLNENKPGYHATKHKSAPALVDRLLDNYEDICLTDDPFSAEIFFIPWYRDWFCGAHGRCDYATKETDEEQKLFAHISNFTTHHFGVDFLHRNFGYDHFLCSATMSAINLVPKYQKFFLKEWTNITTFSAVGASAAYYPFATFARFESGVSLDALPWRAPAPGNSRKWLLFMAWGSTSAGRGSLLNQCAARADVCSSLSATRKEVYAAGEGSDGLFRQIVDGYQTATFCVQKGIETCSRKGIIDALALGCIVVLISPCPVEYYNDYIDMRRVTLQVPPTLIHRGLISYLAEVPAAVVRDAQLYLAQNGHRLQFSRIESKAQYNGLSVAERTLIHDDAFFNVLKVAKRTADRAVECDAMSGHYQPRFGVCCQRSNDCDPPSIVAAGVGYLCQAAQKPPCYFPEAQMHDQWGREQNKAADPIVWDDFLRGPKPWIVGPLPNMTWNSTW